VHRLKYDGIVQAASVLAISMAEMLREALLPEDLVVTSVPMPARRRRERGIDHGRELAQCVAAQMHLPYCMLMKRSGGGRTQQGLSREKRLRNLTGAFTAELLDGRPVLLIDDVFTTGATAQICAQALRDAGAGNVWVITATQAQRKADVLRRLFRRKGRE